MASYTPARIWRGLQRRAKERSRQRMESRLRRALGLPSASTLAPLHHVSRAQPCSRLAGALLAGFKHATAPCLQPLPGVSDIEGMSGWSYRSLVNHMMSCLPAARYLEVGSWKGSTACSAAFGNSLHALCIDDWSQFGGPKTEFLENMHRFASSTASWALLEQDFRQVDFTQLGSFDAYLFDGPHLRRDHYAGITRAQPALAPQHILIVDDWNWADVRLGTLHAVRSLGVLVDACIEIRTTLNEAHGQPHGRTSEWHNGCFVAVVEKRRAS